MHVEEHKSEDEPITLEDEKERREEAFSKVARVADLDKEFASVPTSTSHQVFGVLKSLKDSYFGHAIFIAPDDYVTRHSIFCVATGASRLALRFEMESLDFRWSRGVQAGGALYVFFFGKDKPVQAMKISNLPGEPTVEDLPGMPGGNCPSSFAVACLAESTIIVSGGSRWNRGLLFGA